MADGKECGKTNFHGLRDLNPMSDITAAAAATERVSPRSLARSAVGFGRSPENSVGVGRRCGWAKAGGAAGVLSSSETTSWKWLRISIPGD